MGRVWWCGGATHRAVGGGCGWEWIVVGGTGSGSRVASAGQGIWRPFGMPPPTAAAGTYCPALTICRTPQSISDTTTTCCPIAGTWTVDECAGAMACDAATKKCVCPANQGWCGTTNACLVVDGASKTDPCSCDFQCKGAMTCQGGQCLCPAGQDWCAAADDCKAIDGVVETGTCFCDFQCKDDMKCQDGAGINQCLCPTAGYTWCPSRNACFPSANGLTATGSACCSDWATDQCAGDMSCTLSGTAAVCDCVAAGKNFCVALSSCLTPFAANSQTEGVACCPDADWPSLGTDECKGTMTCDATTTPPSCQCPPATLTETWCDTANGGAGGCLVGGCPVGSCSAGEKCTRCCPGLWPLGSGLQV